MWLHQILACKHLMHFSGDELYRYYKYALSIWLSFDLLCGPMMVMCER
jgi:hypothetical protein